ncbi:RHS repeat domain-containing protein [Dawidia soli]|uniref:YD repeat-containing protein n=1 Tax=Dawidia soli TaxID=2782352 RepID=A0AAP2DCB9_9BACT|nr:hypothetical protein [Dawidia soli]MBT1689139.1 hypothetical protein [Dawidia soli]
MRKTATFAAAMTVQIIVVAQSGLPAPPASEYLPPAPTAAGFQKYVDTPVNLSTGTPEISVPLYEIAVGDFKLPITLNYHAGGHLVQDGASWVGLGWSLSIPGTITRSIRGREDDGSYPNFFGDWDQEMLDASNAADYARLSTLTQGIIDGLPDLYSYNVPGYSGRFMFPDGANAVLMPVQPMRINGAPGSVASIVADDGTLFAFEKLEISSTRSSTTASRPVTSYYLTKITTAAGKVIDFEYDKRTNFQQNVNMSYSETYKRISTGKYMLESTNNDSFVTNVEGHCLTAIKFPGGKVVFNSDNIRRDVIKKQDTEGDYRLTSMEVQDEVGTVTKKIYFNTDYFNSGSQDPNTLRLKLTGLEIGNGNEYPQTYSFTYNEQYNLPSRMSYARDHWGYANARDQRLPDFDPNSGVVDASAKNADPARGQSNILTRITYPTGGHTEYLYEPHDYYDPSESTFYVKREVIVEAPHNRPPVEGDPYDPTINGSGPISIKPGSRKVNLYTYMEKPYWSNPHGSMYIKLYTFGAQGETIYADATLSQNGNHDVYTTGSAVDNFYIYAEASVQDSWVRAILTWEEPVRSVVLNPICGGIRIKKIVQYDGIDHAHDIIKNYTYRQLADPEYSSGTLLMLPDYTEDVHYFDNCIGELGVACEEHTAKRITAQSTVPLGTGSHISYSDVTVTYGDQGQNGKTTYTFTYAPNPSKENSDTNWRRGMLLSQTDWDANGNPLQSTTNTYKVKPSSYQRFYGSIVADLGKHKAASSTMPSDAFPRYFGQHPAVIETEFQYVATQEEITYNPADRTKYVRQFREFAYESPAHVYTTQQTMLSSVPGEKIYTRFLYPQDYPEGTPFIDDMKSDFIVRKPIETVTYKTTPTGSTVLSGNVTVFRTGGLPAEQWQLESYPLPPLPQFRFSNQSVAGIISDGIGDAMFSKDIRYKIKRSYDLYDNNNNLLQYTEASVPTALRWGLQGTVVIAVASFARSEQIFYTSFEESGVVDANAKAGLKSMNTPYNFVPPAELIISADTELSYWTFKSGSWELKRQPYTGGVVNINDGTKIDELRVSPRNAQMSTYAHKPLIGISGILDSNQQATYYDYNDVGQLTHIRDQKGRIVKAFSYHYNSQ